jgi:cytochrome c peroxidase
MFRLLPITVLLAGAACAADISPARLKPYAPVPSAMESKSNPITEAKIELGRMLYFEPRLSKNQKISCNTCHQLGKYGVDNEATSGGHKGVRGDRNSPTVYHAAGHLAQFWDGRAPDVEEQAKGPVMNPVEMAMPGEKHVLTVLNSMPEYVALFQKAFPGEKDPVTFNNMARAIGAFERKLVTPARWDKFLTGDKNALTDAEKAGFNKYVDVGCGTCHNGAYLGGASFMKLGMAKPWADTKDPGRMKVTQKEGDKQVFKVPSLRNIEKTGPYYHDGKVKTLEEAVSLMATHQLGKTLTKDEVASIVTFLKTLTGELPSAYIKEPALPKSTAKTPKPETGE